MSRIQTGKIELTDAEILELWEECQAEADGRYTAEAPLGDFSDVRISAQEGWIEREGVLRFARELIGKS